mmetsp:Transcript_38847/g.91420  ORF Transcript_38847/g.91420 Transcript_38847/m.91420 type:complete len:506 (-) Transcript_38847:41-1558(-)
MRAALLVGGISSTLLVASCAADAARIESHLLFPLEVLDDGEAARSTDCEVIANAAMQIIKVEYEDFGEVKAKDEEGEAEKEAPMLRAARLFAHGIHHCTRSWEMFTNYAALLAQHLASSNFTQEGSATLLCEAVAATRIGVALGATEQTELLDAILDLMRQAGQQEGDCAGGPKVGLPEAHESRADDTQHVRRVNAFCKSGAALAVRPSKREQDLGRWTAQSLWKAFKIMTVCGAASLEQILAIEVLNEVASEAEIHRAEAVDRGDSVVVAPRGGSRWEVKLPLRHPFTAPQLTQSPLLVSMVKMLMGYQIELDTFSMIHSDVGSPTQAWHEDVPVPQVRSGSAEPAVGLVVVVPLVNITRQNGATSFVMGSHVDLGERYWVEAAGVGADAGAADVTSHITLEADVGSIVLFNLRMRHCGGGNRGTEPRPILYMSYVQDWFRDATNFRSMQSQAWDKMTDASKKLFGRLDAQDFLQQLYSKAQACDEGVAAMASSSSVRPGRLEL